MGFYQALNFAKLMRREAHTARNGHVMQPKFGGGSALRAFHGQESTRQRALCSLTWAIKVGVLFNTDYFNTDYFEPGKG